MTRYYMPGEIGTPHRTQEMEQAQRVRARRLPSKGEAISSGDIPCLNVAAERV